jgi:hypothetical protein
MDIVRKIFTGWQVTNEKTFGRMMNPVNKLPIFKSISQNRMGHIDSRIEYSPERYQVDFYKKINKNFYTTGEDYIPASMLENANYKVEGEE